MAISAKNFSFLAKVLGSIYKGIQEPLLFLSRMSFGIFWLYLRVTFEGKYKVFFAVQAASETPPPSPRRRRATLPALRAGGGNADKGGEVKEGSCCALGVGGLACGLRR